MTDDIEKDDFTEIVDARIGRVDLVGAPANGIGFLFAKSAEGMVPADMVRELIEKADMAATDAKEAVVADEVEKADLEVGDLIEDGGTTADSAPGSPDWEEKDATTALNALNALTRVKAVLSYLAGRETQEAAAGESDGYDNAWDLEDAASAIDCAIDLVAPYAVGEQIESEMSEEAEGVIKALAGMNPRSLEIAESMASIAKSGRVLSAANESALRDAASSIEKVLASLPAAPEAEVPVEKAEEHAVDEVEKADGDAPEAGDDDSSLVLVYDSKGNIIGAVDPTEIVSFAETPSGAKAEEPTNNQDAEPVGAEPTSADLKPAPAAAAGAPDAAPAPEPVEKGSEEPNIGDLSVDELIKAAESDEDPRMRALVKALQAANDQVELLKALPATPRAVANGVSTPVLRGQADDTRADEGRVADLKKQATSEDVATRESALRDLQTLAIAEYARTRQNPVAFGQ